MNARLPERGGVAMRVFQVGTEATLAFKGDSVGVLGAQRLRALCVAGKVRVWGGVTLWPTNARLPKGRGWPAWNVGTPAPRKAGYVGDIMQLPVGTL